MTTGELLRHLETLTPTTGTVRDGVLYCDGCDQPMRPAGDIGQTLVGYGRGECGSMHDDNCMSQSYTCANNHVARVSIRRTCERCDWKGKTACFCHAGEKLEAWPS